MKITKSISSKLKNIRLIAMDVDGVLTAGEVIVLNSGEEVKVWNVKDRMGFHLLKKTRSGIKLAWITGRKSLQVTDRAAEVGVDELFQGCDRKDKPFLSICEKYAIKPEEALYIGDDLIDISVMRLAGISMCPHDSPQEVKKEADLVSKLYGGKGIAREAIELVLKAKSLWSAATEGYIK